MLTLSVFTMSLPQGCRELIDDDRFSFRLKSVKQLLVLDFISWACNKQLEAIEVSQLRGKCLCSSDSLLAKSFIYCVWEDGILVLGANLWKISARSNQETQTFQETRVAKGWGSSALRAKCCSKIPSLSSLLQVLCSVLLSENMLIKIFVMILSQQKSYWQLEVFIKDKAIYAFLSIYLSLPGSKPLDTSILKSDKAI